MPIHVKLLYFGQTRDASGKSEEEFSLADGSSLRSLLNQASERHEKLDRLRKSIKVALNEEMARGDEKLNDGDVIALLPPVAGG